MAYNIFSAGSWAKSSEVNENFNDTLKTSCDIAMLNTTNLDVMDEISSPYKIVDLFSDSNGYKNTADTTNTTSQYFSSIYYSKAGTTPLSPSPVSEPSFETETNWTTTHDSYSSSGQSTSYATDGTYSHRLHQSISVYSGSAESTATVYQTIDVTNISKITFDLKYYFYFNNDGKGHFYTKLDSSLLYSISIDRGAAATEQTYENSSPETKEINTTNYFGNKTFKFESYIYSSWGSSASSSADNYIDNIVAYGYDDSFIQSIDKDVGTGYKSAYIRPKLYEEIPSGASVKAQVSLDGGSTFTSEQDINAIFDLSGLTDTGHLVVRLNQDTDGTVSSKATGWCCLLYK